VVDFTFLKTLVPFNLVKTHVIESEWPRT